jgi:hypothetical protein
VVPNATVLHPSETGTAGDQTSLKECSVYAIYRSVSMVNTTLWQVQGPAASYSGVNGQDLAVLDEHGSGDLGWGSVYVSGKVVGEEATCTDSSGQATLNLSVLGLPAGFATASVTCKFLPWSTLQDLLNATEQVGWADRPVDLSILLLL